MHENLTWAAHDIAVEKFHFICSVAIFFNVLREILPRFDGDTQSYGIVFFDLVVLNNANTMTSGDHKTIRTSKKIVYYNQSKEKYIKSKIFEERIYFDCIQMLYHISLEIIF